MPCCTVVTCISYQLPKKVHTIPPWWVASRYQSEAPSQAHIAASPRGFSDATCHWFIA
jgi:hypothetical protein